jgi:hypothetical protein
MKIAIARWNVRNYSTRDFYHIVPEGMTDEAAMNAASRYEPEDALSGSCKAFIAEFDYLPTWAMGSPVLVPAPAVKPTMLPRAAALTAFIANMPAKPAVATEYEDTDQMGTVKSTMTERIAQALAAEAKSV